MRGQGARSSFGARLKWIENGFRATSGRAIVGDVSTLEEITVETRRGHCLAIRFRSLLHRLDVQLRITDGFGLFEIFAGRAPRHFDRIGSQTLTGGARIVGFRFWSGQRHDRAAFSAHLFQETAIALCLEIDIERTRAAELHIGIGVERLRANVARAVSAL